jgi:hypothetical protein
MQNGGDPVLLFASLNYALNFYKGSSFGRQAEFEGFEDKLVLLDVGDHGAPAEFAHGVNASRDVKL